MLESLLWTYIAGGRQQAAEGGKKRVRLLEQVVERPGAVVALVEGALGAARGHAS